MTIKTSLISKVNYDHNFRRIRFYKNILSDEKGNAKLRASY